MESPQLENGYTRIANEILEQTSKAKFNATQLKILLTIWRYTYGFNRKEHSFALTFLSEATGSHKSQLKKEVDKLIEYNVINVRKEATFNSARVLSLNKDYSKWQCLQVVNSSTVSESTTSTVSESTYSGVSESTYQERKVKDNTKEKDFKSVFDYYLELNLIKHRAYTKDMQKAITKACKDNKYDIEFCKILLDRHKKVIDLTKNKDFSVKVRSFSEFFGQKVFNATHLICAEYDEGGKYYEQYLKDNVINLPKKYTDEDLSEKDKEILKELGIEGVK